MRLSKRGEYGLRAMIDLATWEADSGNNTAQIKEIATREKIPAKFLEQIMLALKNAGLLNSKMGFGGGYYLAKPASEITLGQIFSRSGWSSSAYPLCQPNGIRTLWVPR